MSILVPLRSSHLGRMEFLLPKVSIDHLSCLCIHLAVIEGLRHRATVTSAVSGDMAALGRSTGCYMKFVVLGMRRCCRSLQGDRISNETCSS